MEHSKVFRHPNSLREQNTTKRTHEHSPSTEHCTYVRIKIIERQRSERTFLVLTLHRHCIIVTRQRHEEGQRHEPHTRPVERRHLEHRDVPHRSKVDEPRDVACQQETCRNNTGGSHFLQNQQIHLTVWREEGGAIIECAGWGSPNPASVLPAVVRAEIQQHKYP